MVALKNIGQTGGELKERLSIYRQHIRQPEYEKIEVERHLRTCAKGIFKGYLHYKMITPQNVLSEAQVKNFFIL